MVVRCQNPKLNMKFVVSLAACVLFAVVPVMAATEAVTVPVCGVCCVKFELEKLRVASELTI